MGRSTSVSVQAGREPPPDWLSWLIPGVILGTVLYIVLIKR